MATQPSDAIAAPAGLTGAEARRRLGEHGPNAVIEPASPALRRFATKLWGPIPWLLELAIVLQLGLGERGEAALIAALLGANAALGVLQEGRASAALAALQKRLAPTALALRDGAWMRLPAAELVPGDAIRLPLGALVPADARIASGSVLVDESTLTGESAPVERDAGEEVCAGALVRRGQALAEVTATGDATRFGRAAELVRIARAASTEQAAILGVTRNLATVNGVVAALLVGYAWASAFPSTELARLALTALLGSIPVALPATFTLSAALAAQTLARRGVLLTRLSAASEAPAMDVLCADKTGTLTRNALEVVDVRGFGATARERVLALAVLASSEADQDPIDAAIRAAASRDAVPAASERLERFVPFDPALRTAEARARDAAGRGLRILKGAFEVVTKSASAPAEAARVVDDIAAAGRRVIAVAAGPPDRLDVIGLIALSDPPRAESADLIRDLRDLGVRTLMVTGDSATTAAAIAREVGIAGEVGSVEEISEGEGAERFGLVARVAPEQKYRIVQALQARGHVVGMCGDGVNDAPALRQAQIGIAVSSATDVAKAAAGMVMTEPGLAGIVFAVQEGRVAFHRLRTYTLNMLVKKAEVVVFLAVALALTGRVVLTPALMVLMVITNDLLSMSLTTDRAGFSRAPSVWRMPRITAAAVALAACKLVFSVGVLAFGALRLRLSAGELQTLALVTLVLGNQALLYALRDPRRLWSSRPGPWVVAASAADVGLVSALALSGTFVSALAPALLLGVLVAAIGLSLLLDQAKRPILAAFKVE